MAYQTKTASGATTDQIEPTATASTNRTADSTVVVTLPPGDGELMYWPEHNGFIALWPHESGEFMTQAVEHSIKIDKLQIANKAMTEAAVKLREAQKSGVAADIKAANAEIEKAINEVGNASKEARSTVEGLSKLDAKGGVKMVELVPLKKFKDQKTKPIYIKSTALKKVLADNRVYLIDSEKEKREKEKILSNGTINTKEIKHRIAEKVQDKAKFKKEWKLKPDDAKEYTGVLGEWAQVMNGDISKFIDRNKEDLEKKFNINPNDEHRNVDLTAEAQLMRYTAGAGLEVNFKPFQGNFFDKRDKNWKDSVKRAAKSGAFGIKASAEASFAVAEGRVGTQWYWPHYAGWHATPSVAGQTFELGFWRFYGEIILAGGAGASVAIEANLGITVTGGKQGIRGIPPANKNKSGVKTSAGAEAGLDAFAGVRGSIDAKGALQWLNPEGQASQGKPIKVDSPVAEYKDMAEVDAGVAGMAGASIKGAFTFAHKDGMFVIHAKLGACLGLGGDATMTFKAGTATIGEFFKCMAYQLKRADFHKIADAITDEAFKTYSRVMYMVIAQGRKLTDFTNKSIQAISDEFNDLIDTINKAIKDGNQKAKEFLDNIRKEFEKQTASWFAYANPEVQGQIYRQIASAGLSDNLALRDLAPQILAMATGAPQTSNHLETITERMTLAMGDKQDKAAGEALINQCVAGTPYANCLQQAKERLASVEPLMSRAFIWNDTPEFAVAKIGIEHAMFA
jgi:hypothetical protein